MSSFLLIHFSFFLSDSFISTILSSTSLILSSSSRVLFYYLLPPESFDLIYCIIHYILTLFISSRSLLNLYCIFSILVSRLFICDSILLSRFWIIFTVIIRNSLSGRFLFCLGWWVFILFVYLLGIPLSLHLVYIAAFEVAFLYSGSLWSSLYCGVSSLRVGL